MQYSCSLDMVRFLKSAGYVEGRETSADSRSILEVACGCKSLHASSIVDRLLEKGADLNLPGCRCYTALQTACAMRGADIRLVGLLLEKSAEINTIGGRYCTAVHAACSSHDNFSVLKLLLDNGADFRI